MHMADALLSPTTGLLMWATSGAVLAVSARRVRRDGDERLVPLMGLLGAFVFALQMINFAIPLTGSTGTWVARCCSPSFSARRRR